ncbi:hypothetical protein CASFOL_038501 [Castilleja foliolosa]|uniref:GRF-type domain-containing protein n=1 Tax=Castilleja foliolosa TaxID=1961234 RepID=A0ABD3BL43_9LAMI
MSSRSSKSNQNRSGDGSGSRSSNSHGNELGRCNCGIQVEVMTEWTVDNPGRRYEACPNYKIPSSCGFFRWIDEEMCSRSKHLIPELIRDKNNLELTLITEQAKLKCVQAVMERQGKALGHQKSLDERLNIVLAAQRDLTLHLGLCEKKERKLKIIIAAMVLVIAFQVMMQPAFGRSRG